MSNIAALANDFIALNAQIDALKAKQDALREQILATGYDRLAGDTFDVQVYLSQRKVLDEDKLNRLYNITGEQLKAFNACKKDGGEFPVVKVVAKK
jgi:hypothetical protein